MATSLRLWLIHCVAWALLASWQVARGDEALLSVRTDFPGGAARVLAIDQHARKVTFEVPVSPRGAARSWWYFRVDGATAGEQLTLELQFGRTRVKRAVYSSDGKSWRFTEPAVNDLERGTSTFLQKVDGPQSWFAWYVPYVAADAAAIVDRAERLSPHATKFELCRSEADRPVWGVRVSEPGVADDARYGVWIQARQHAWELGGSWSAHGLIEWLVSADETAQTLRRRAQVFVLPLMDVDSAEMGSGGKWQEPHDHNRDWSEKPYWKAVQAAMSRCRELDDDSRLDVFLDLHDPTWEAGFEFWCNPYPRMIGNRRRNTDHFLMCARGEILGPLAFDPEVFAPYPVDTPTAGNWSSQRTRSHVVGGTCEIGIYPSAGLRVAPPLQHKVAGQQLGQTLERYLRTNPRRLESR